MQPIDKVLAILQKTHDGDSLTPTDLRLVENAANSNLTQRGLELLDSLYQTVIAGEYESSDQRSLLGVAHLTRDAEGYVYWKKLRVEHFSHHDAGAMLRDAQALAARCQALEDKGFPVNSRTAICPVCETAPADSPWKDVLGQYYAFFEGNGRNVAILYCKCDANNIAVVEKDSETGAIQVNKMDSAYDAFHFVENQGLTHRGPARSYETLAKALEATRLTPEELRNIIS